jgi:hypothetical protein
MIRRHHRPLITPSAMIHAAPAATSTTTATITECEIASRAAEAAIHDAAEQIDVAIRQSPFECGTEGSREHGAQADAGQQ